MPLKQYLKMDVVDDGVAIFKYVFIEYSNSINIVIFVCNLIASCA